MQIASLGVLGAGQMGRGIAQVAAQTGLSVVLVDVDQATAQRGRDEIGKQLARLVEKGKLDGKERDATLERIAAGKDASAFAPMDAVVEAATENFELKSKLFAAA